MSRDRTERPDSEGRRVRAAALGTKEWAGPA